MSFRANIYLRPYCSLKVVGPLIQRSSFCEINRIHRIEPNRTVNGQIGTSINRTNAYHLNVYSLTKRVLCSWGISDHSDTIDGNEEHLMDHDLPNSTKLPEQLINAFIRSKNEDCSAEEWQALIEKVAGFENGQYNEENIDGKIVDVCDSFCKLALARSYLSFMKSRHKKFNAAVVSAFIKICYNNRALLTESDQLRVAQFTNFLLKKYEKNAFSVCDAIIYGLLCQNKLDEAVVALTKTESQVAKSFYSPVICALLEDGCVSKAFDVIEKALVMKISLDSAVFTKYIDISGSNLEMLRNLLTCFVKYNIKPQKVVCDKLIAACETSFGNYKMIGSFGTVSESGVCCVCGKSLKLLNLTQQEFLSLRDMILKDVLIRGDVFKTSNPIELQKFLRQVHSWGPFDVVIDGPNLVYLTGVNTEKKHIYSRIRHVVNHFKQQRKKMLIILKSHMFGWKGFADLITELGVPFILLDDSSEDDAFMLYATIYSGQNTYFLTKDRLIRERILLAEENMELFERWCTSHRMHIEFISQTGRAIIKDPIQFEIVAQSHPPDDGNANGQRWHIPYTDHCLTPTITHVNQIKWLCLQITTNMHR